MNNINNLDRKIVENILDDSLDTKRIANIFNIFVWLVAHIKTSSIICEKWKEKEKRIEIPITRIDCIFRASVRLPFRSV